MGLLDVQDGVLCQLPVEESGEGGPEVEKAVLALLGDDSLPCTEVALERLLTSCVQSKKGVKLEKY